MTLTKPIGAIEKNSSIMEKLNKRFIGNEKGGFSATLLNNYLACPLKFYLENVESVDEDDEVYESVDSKLFGTIYHNVIHKIYDKYRKEIVSTQILDKELSQRDEIESIIVAEIKKELNIKQILGNNIIITELIKKYIGITLVEDKKFAPFTYISGEDRFKISLPILPDCADVNFKAFVDRIDRLDNGVYRIIDYKTGSVEKKPKDFTPSLLFLRGDKKPMKEIFQLYFYAFILSNLSKREFNINDDLLNTSMIYYFSLLFLKT